MNGTDLLGELTRRHAELGGAEERLFRIDGVPVVVTDNHQQVLPYWDALRGATLLHVDAHPDTGSSEPLPAGGLTPEFLRGLGVGNLIAPAFALDIVTSMYWLNPHSRSARFQYLGSSSRRLLRRWLSVGIIDGMLKFVTGRTRQMLLEGADLTFLPYQGVHLEQPPASLRQARPLILDIDLDAFCCNKHIFYVPRQYDGVNGFERRVEETMRTLHRCARPTLVTVTESNGRGNCGAYVPETMIAPVEKALVAELQKLYC